VQNFIFDSHFSKYNTLSPSLLSTFSNLYFKKKEKNIFLKNVWLYFKLKLNETNKLKKFKKKTLLIVLSSIKN
jgi:hypothetical protein